MVLKNTTRISLLPSIGHDKLIIASKQLLLDRPLFSETCLIAYFSNSAKAAGVVQVAEQGQNHIMKRARRIPPSFAHKVVAKPRYSLGDLLLQIPEDIPINTEWEAMPPVGREIDPAVTTLRTIRLMKRFMRKQQRKQLNRGIDLRHLVNEGRD